MAVDEELIKRLNLIRTQPKFSFREAESGKVYCESVNPIPANRGFCWVAGSTQLKNGTTIDSVFVVDTDSGAEQWNVYWFVDGVWYEHKDSEELAKALGIPKTDIFPYKWKYHIPIEGDVNEFSE